MSFSLRAPRVALGLCLTLLLALVLATVAPAASGQPAPQPSASGSSPPATVFEVELLNPSPAYDDPPKVSDRPDGTDSRYTIVARTTGTPRSAIVEASIALEQDDGTFGNDITIGELTRVTSESDVWELEWDIPSSVPDGNARFTVRAFAETAQGFVETDGDATVASISHTDLNTPFLGAWETTELTWPQQDGPLGWYKPRVGAWRVTLSGTTSPGASFVQMFVSTSPSGEPLRFTPCGTSATIAHPAGHDTFQGKCTLSALELPSKVRAVAAVAEFRQEASGFRLTNAADVAVVRPYTVEPEEMSVRISPEIRRVAAPATACTIYSAIVSDDHGQPVLGANVDVHVGGPSDNLTVTNTGLVVPEGHAVERSPTCPGGPPVPSDPKSQGDHNVPGGTDQKHLETSSGSGIDYPALPPGQVLLLIASDTAGFTDVTAWVDDEEIRRETDQRPADNDRLDEGEPVGHGRIQWVGAPVTVSLDPVGGTSPAGSCFPYTVKARAGTTVLPGINVDVHATGPGDGVDFCDPAGAVARRAPVEGSGSTRHTAESASESHHFDSAGADVQHTEGETDETGNFVVGLTSPEPGDSSVVAWIDGEAGSDDDALAFGEPSVSGTVSWVTSAAESELGFVNPSPFGGTTAGAGTGTQLPDSGGTVDILVRADMAGDVPGVEILLSRDGRRTYEHLGEAERVGRTDLYELTWRVDVPDGAYGLRARVVSTGIVEDIDVRVGAGDRAPMTPNDAFESLRLTQPERGAGLAFMRRVATLTGRASAGAEGVDVFYTKVPSKDTPAAADWVFCGYADLLGTGAASQDFTAACALAGSDQPSQVTGVAAITYDCTVPGCDANPTPPPAGPAPPSPAPAPPSPPREQGQKDTGEAVRVFGYEANPLLGLEPAETAAEPGECRRLTLLLHDQSSQPISGSNVDLHLAAASPTAHFCRPPDASPRLRPPDAGGHAAGSSDLETPHEGGGPLHTEAETLPDGTVVVGVTSAEAGDTQVSAWLDRNDDDVQDGGEVSDSTIVHWTAPGGCTLSGSEGPDVLRGTRGADVICALEGNDVVRGRGGRDVVFGGAGADVLRGGGGRDTLRGAKGRDRIQGGRGRDTCRGGPGRDRLVGCELPRRTAVAPRRGGV